MEPRAGTRERILGVAKRLFAARGFEHASTSSIAREAGTSESQLMKHFGNKAGLLEAIFNENWSRITQNARGALEDLPPSPEKLARVSQIVFAAMDSDPELKLLMLLEGRRIRREGQMVAFTEGFMSFIQLLDAILEEMKTAGQLRAEIKPQAVRSALMGAVEGMLRDCFLAQKLGYPADFDSQQVETMLSMILAACACPVSVEAA